jgi:hypothetical protein
MKQGERERASGLKMVTFVNGGTILNSLTKMHNWIGIMREKIVKKRKYLKK